MNKIFLVFTVIALMFVSCKDEPAADPKNAYLYNDVWYGLDEALIKATSQESIGESILYKHNLILYSEKVNIQAVTGRGNVLFFYLGLVDEPTCPPEGKFSYPTKPGYYSIFSAELYADYVFSTNKGIKINEFETVELTIEKKNELYYMNFSAVIEGGEIVSGSFVGEILTPCP